MNDSTAQNMLEKCLKNKSFLVTDVLEIYHQECKCYRRLSKTAITNGNNVSNICSEVRFCIF